MKVDGWSCGSEYWMDMESLQGICLKFCTKSPQEIAENLAQNHPKGIFLFSLSSFNPDPTVRHTWFTLVIGGMGTYLSLYAISQAQVQRLISVKTLRNAQLSLWWQWPILTSLSLTTSFSGLVIYWYYRTCDPLLAGRINARDQNMPMYIMDALSEYPGIAGLFVAGVFSACLSTVSTALNSLAAVTLEDYVKNLYLWIKKQPFDPTGKDSALITKILAAIYGVMSIGIAFMTRNLGGVLQASLTIFGAVGGPLLGTFSLGMFTRVANQYGVITGHLIGLSVSMWSQFGGPRPPPPLLDFSVDDCSDFDGFKYNVTVPSVYSEQEEPTYFYLYRISYIYSSVIGFLLTFVIGYVVSYVLYLLKLQTMEKIYKEGMIKEVNENLFAPPMARLFRTKK